MRIHAKLLLLCTLLIMSFGACGPANADAPHDITASQKIWLDGLDITGTDTGAGGPTAPISGATVASWKDKSANGFVAGSATNFTAGYYTSPTYSSAGQGVSFDGVWNVLEVPSGLYGVGTTVTASDIYVVASTTTVKNSFLLLSGPTYNTGNRISAHIPWSDGTIYWDQPCCTSNGGRLTASWSGTSSATNTPYVWNFQAISGSTQYIYRNGTTLATGTAGSYTQNSDNQFYVGGGENTSGNNFNGVISEMIIYSTALNTAQHRILLSYLQAKYQTPGGLGTDSRYTNTAYRYEVGGIGIESDGSQTTGTSAGLTIGASTFLASAGTYLIAGLPSLTPATGTTTANLPANVTSRAARVWYMQKTGGTTGSATLGFNPAQMGLSPVAGQTWDLLYTSSATGTYSVLQSATYSSGNIAFTVPAASLTTGYYTIGYPVTVNLTMAKNSSIVNDPVNGTSNPKAIPGAVVMYQIVLTNNQGSPDSGTVAITDPLPANVILYVGNLSGGAPYIFTDGTPSSGLSMTWVSLASTTDSIQFFNAAGTQITPVPDANGFDANVRSIKLLMNGQFNAKTGATAPNCNIQFQVKIQ